MMTEPGRSDMEDSLMNPPAYAFHSAGQPAVAEASQPSSRPADPSNQKDNQKDEELIPKSYPSRLALPNDNTKLSPLHCFLRSELLEIFVVGRSNKKTPMYSPESSVGRVGLRCVFCARERQRQQGKIPHDEAPMAVFYPKAIAEVYRLIISWQRCHLRKCRNLPPELRNKWTMLREKDKSRGKTQYWLTSAQEIGLVDCQSRAGGIRFSKSMIAASHAKAGVHGEESSARKTPSPDNDDKQRAKSKEAEQRTVSPTNSNEEKIRGDQDSNWAPPKTGIPTKEQHAAAPPQEMVHQEEEDALLKKLQQSDALMVDPPGAGIDDPLPLSHGAPAGEPLLLPTGSSDSAQNSSTDQNAASKPLQP